MRTVWKAALITAVVGALGVSGSLFAWANWTITSTPTQVKVQALQMPDGVAVSAATQGSDAVVTWSAQEIEPGVKMQRYVVTAHSENPAPLPDIVRTVAATDANGESLIFTGAELAGGKWKWGVQPQYGLWIGTEGKLSNKLTFGGTPPPVTPNAQITAGATAIPEATAVITSGPATTATATTQQPVEPPTTEAVAPPAKDPAPDPTTSPPAPVPVTTPPDPVTTPPDPPSPAGSVSIVQGE